MTLEKLFDIYEDMFKEGFPTFQVCRSRTKEETAELVQKCIDESKDAYELGYCTDDASILY